MKFRAIMVMLTASVLLEGCGTSYPVIKDYCPQLGRALTNQERILKGLEYFYNEDERLLRDFPKGAKFSDYIGVKTPNNTELPFNVPLHFQVEKREFQTRKPSLNRDEFLRDYYKRFPACCEVVEPAYRREKWDYEYFVYNVGKDTQWLKDVWVKRAFPFRKIENFKPGYYARTSFDELRSDVCGETDNLRDERG